MILYHVTKFSVYLSFTVHTCTKIGRSTPIRSLTIVLSCFYQLISHSENFSTWISRLPFAVNAMLIFLIPCVHFIYASKIYATVEIHRKDRTHWNRSLRCSLVKAFKSYLAKAAFKRVNKVTVRPTTHFTPVLWHHIQSKYVYWHQTYFRPVKNYRV